MASRRTIQVVVAKRDTVCSGPSFNCSSVPTPSPTGGSDPTGTTDLPTSTSSPSGDDSTLTSSVTTSSSSDPTSSSSSSTFIGATTPAPSSTSSQSPAVNATSTTSNAGTIAGSVVGGVVFLVLVALALLLYLRARRRKRIAPSSEFMNSFRTGTAPVLRLDSGAEFTPTIPEKGGGYTHYPTPGVPLPFTQNSYYSNPPTQNMKFPDELMLADIPSARPSVDQPLHPQRFSTQATNESFGNHHHSSSVGSRRELWGSDTEIHVNASDLSPVRLSPRTDSVLQFAPRFSLDDLSSQPSQSPPSLHPLRRQPD
ncbi:hypothetical protein JVU11DRAFT_342 [Chiua virens]|nr:hypothetical protein JVU11DRAFT_342 [Chiua virens]